VNPFALRQNKPEKMPVNPLDRSTIFSILPKKITEKNCTLDPGIFVIEPGTETNPTRLVVGPSSWWKDVSNGDDSQPLVEIPQSSILIADSVVRDYCNGILACNMGDSMPGLFWLPGNVTVNELKEKHKEILEGAKKKQRNWFNALIKMADMLWARSSGNPLAISEDMKMAAKEINVTRDWTRNFEHIEMISCHACGQLVRNTVIVCSNCKIVMKPDEFKKLNLSFAS